jgi:hypothetical protein
VLFAALVVSATTGVSDVVSGVVRKGGGGLPCDGSLPSVFFFGPHASKLFVVVAAAGPMQGSGTCMIVHHVVSASNLGCIIMMRRGEERRGEERRGEERRGEGRMLTVTARTPSSKSGSPGSASRPRARLALRLVLSTLLRNRVRKFSRRKKRRGEERRGEERRGEERRGEERRGEERRGEERRGDKSKKKHLPFSFALQVRPLPIELGGWVLRRQKERANEHFQSGEHRRPADDIDWACPEVKCDDGVDLVGMALRKEDQKREKKGRAQSSAAHRGRTAERAIFLNRKIDQRAKARVGDTRRLQAVAHVGSLKGNNVHVEDSELETELHMIFLHPTSVHLLPWASEHTHRVICAKNKKSGNNFNYTISHTQKMWSPNIA